jgi:hypothetical protein
LKKKSKEIIIETTAKKTIEIIDIKSPGIELC